MTTIDELKREWTCAEAAVSALIVARGNAESISEADELETKMPDTVATALGVAQSYIAGLERQLATLENAYNGLGELYTAEQEDNRLLTDERNRYRDQANGAFYLAVNAQRSAEQQRNLFFNGAQEDR